MAKKPIGKYVIYILGLLAALGPFSIDMYLPGFKVIAADLKTSPSEVSLTLSSYFIGISAGQLLYGPLLDKFGRKKPLYFGVFIYLAACVGCYFSTDINQLIIFRFIQAIGSCATAVASVALVRDLFEADERAKGFASIMLVIALSPMLAPTIGGYLITIAGWHTVFIFLAVMAVLILTLSYFFIPEVYVPDPQYSLKPGPILSNFLLVLKEPQFVIYASVSALIFSGLFVYVASSPIIFMELYGVSETTYGWIFAGLSVAFIGSSQVNSYILRWYSSQKIINYAMGLCLLSSLIFLVFALMGMLNLTNTLVFLALFLAGLGFINPNASALSLEPFSKNAGSASALMGALQMGLGALVSAVASSFPAGSVLPMPLAMAVASVIAAVILAATKQPNKRTSNL
ncbi:multidrug effflux MFS transporter [Mucilaginibacter pallidiroseus]|uniref:Multidrug effflux MFS transporter n=1 Tax=Mucilaginibacter pallidiroseus TaxID=2599295 RepID=A0A563UE35_9SPHI|nr:multidrug effflux MFS transporter [Mucilaginibacter pallidiroseus]TWR29611.1 multidrug effflux MFS transporter [Mucilaginibacter pallidiroseus]